MKINPGNARGLLVPQGDRPFSFVVYSSEIRDFGLLHGTCKALTKQQSELGHGSSPLGRSTLPGGREIHDGQVNQLLGSVLIGEQSARLDHLPDSTVEPFNRIGRIDQRTDLRRKLEERDYLCPGAFPDLDDGRVFLPMAVLPKRSRARSAASASTA